MVYKLSKHIGLILFLNITQAPMEVTVQLGSDDKVNIILSDTELSRIGYSKYYDRRLFEDTVRAHLVKNKEHDEYDYRYSQAVEEYLPEKLLGHDKIELKWVKAGPYCFVRSNDSDPDAYDVYFPQIHLEFGIYDKDKFLGYTEMRSIRYEGEDLLKLYGANLKINRIPVNVSKHCDPSIGSDCIISTLDLILDEKSVQFLDKIRPLLIQQPNPESLALDRFQPTGEFSRSKYIHNYRFAQLLEAIKLAKMSQKSEETDPNMELPPDDKQVISDFLKSVGLLPPEDLRSRLYHFMLSAFC